MEPGTDKHGAPRTGALTSTPPLWLAGIIAAIGVYAVADDVYKYATTRTWLFDAHAYWMTGQEGYEPYVIPPGFQDAFLYSPAFAQAISPITWLPWPAFATIWVSLNLAAFLWLFRPLGWVWTVALMIWCIPELIIGNVYALLAVSTVVALTGRAQAWAVPILTKPTLGIGLLWHLIRREWRELVVSSAAVGAVVALSFLLDPQMWRAWLGFLLDQSFEEQAASPLFLWRLAAALVVGSLAALSGWIWAIPFSLLLALPVMGGISVLTILSSIPRLWLWHVDNSQPRAVTGGAMESSRHIPTDRQ